MFRFTQEPSSGSKRQYLAKITDMVRRCLSIRNVVSIMAAYSGLLCVRVVYRAGRDCQWFVILMHGAFMKRESICWMIC